MPRHEYVGQKTTFRSNLSFCHTRTRLLLLSLPLCSIRQALTHKRLDDLLPPPSISPWEAWDYMGAPCCIQLFIVVGESSSASTFTHSEVSPAWWWKLSEVGPGEPSLSHLHYTLKEEEMCEAEVVPLSPLRLTSDLYIHTHPSMCMCSHIHLYTTHMHPHK